LPVVQSVGSLHWHVQRPLTLQQHRIVLLPVHTACMSQQYPSQEVGVVSATPPLPAMDAIVAAHVEKIATSGIAALLNRFMRNSLCYG
jgi:hypothetical protein